MSQDRNDPGDDDPGDEAMEVLRGIWTARRQSVADVAAAPSNAKACKNLKNIGFAGIAEGGADGDSTAGPVGEDLRAAWRTKLAREGKIAPGATSVRDLLRGEAPSGEAPSGEAQGGDARGPSPH